MHVKDITDHLESIAPLSLQESYDNAGLITGDPDWEVRGVSFALILLPRSSTRRSKKDAISSLHTTRSFSAGLKNSRDANYIQRTVI